MTSTTIASSTVGAVEEAPTDPELIREGMTGILRQGLELLKALDDDDYVRSVDAAFGSTIGGHYRHCLEHVEPLVAGASSVIDYDARQRDPAVETNRRRAVSRTEELLRDCLAMDPDTLFLPVRARYKVSYDSPREPAADSTLGREFMFAISHAVHHFALVGIMAKLQGIHLPENLGMAPSTAKYRDTKAD